MIVRRGTEVIWDGGGGGGYARRTNRRLRRRIRVLAVGGVGGDLV